MKSLSTAGLIFSAAVLSAPGAAQGQMMYGAPDTFNDPGMHIRQSDISIMAWLPWYYGFGFGVDARYEIPILPDGFLPGINDEFSIEPSLGLAFTNYGYLGDNASITDIAPALYGIWSFHFSQQFRAYIGLGLGYNIGIYSGPYADALSISYFYWDPVLGLNFKFTPNFGIRLEAGAQGPKGGLSIYF